MESQLVILSEELSKSKVDPQTAIQLKSHFEPFEHAAREWKEKAESLIVTDENQVDEMQQAREARLALKNIRVSVDKKHKELKEDALRYGQLVDSIRRGLNGLITPIEDHLLKQEQFIQLKEKERKEKLFVERSSLLSEYMDSSVISTMQLGDLSDEAFDNLLNGQKLAHDERVKAERKAERERVKAEKEKADADKKLREENERLRKEQDKWNKRINKVASLGCKWNDSQQSYEFECDDFAFSIAMVDIKTWSDAKFDPIIEEAEKMFGAWNTKLQKQKEATERKLKKEREERQRLEREQRERKEQEEAERKAKAAAERKLKRAPDKQKLMTFAENLRRVECESLKDEEAKAILTNAVSLISKVERYIKSNAEKL